MQDVPLQTAEDEGGGHAVETAERLGVGVFDDGQLERIPEPVVAVQESRHQEIEDAPQLAQAVFDGGAGQGEPLAAAQRLDRLGVLGGVIFDILRFIEDKVAEFGFPIQGDIPFEQVVGGDRHVVSADPSDGLLPLFGVPEDGQDGQSGANRRISFSQLKISEAGQTTKEGPAVPLPWRRAAGK